MWFFIKVCLLQNFRYISNDSVSNFRFSSDSSDLRLLSESDFDRLNELLPCTDTGGGVGSNRTKKSEMLRLNSNPVYLANVSG